MAFDTDVYAPNPPAEPRQRRSNSERSAATRDKVIRAAIQCLNDLGYEGTTVILVAREAGVSRGAAQHQFPSKVDLMLAVAKHIVNHQSQLRQEVWDSLVVDGESLSKMVDFSWELQSHPENVALLKIMLATRNDEELKARFQPFMDYLAGLRKGGARRLAKLVGAEPDDPDIMALMRLHYGAMRGLAIEALITPENDEILAAVELLKKYERYLIGRVYRRIQGEE